MRKKNKLWDACSAFFEVLGGRSQYTEYDDEGDIVSCSSRGRDPGMRSMTSGHINLYKATNGMILEVSVFPMPDHNGYRKETQPTITFVPEEDMATIGDAITRALTISTLAAK